MRSFSFAAVFFVVAACGLPPEEEVSSSAPAAVASHAEALCSCSFPSMPYIPATPVEFSVRYPPGTPLYSGSRIGSAFTVIFKNSQRPYDFTAYGFDPMNNTNVFFVHGEESDLARFTQQHHIDAEDLGIVLRNAGSMTFLDSIQGQVVGPVPKNPPAGMAFKLSQASFQAAQAYSN